MKRIVPCLGAFVAALPLSLSAAASPTPSASGPNPTSHNQIPINFSIVPAKPILTRVGLTDPSKRHFTFIVSPGQSVSDVLAVVNQATTPLNVSLHASDAQTSLHGGSLAFNDSANQHAVGRWLTLNAQQPVVSVPPRQGALMGLTLSVPSSTTPGEYEGAISGTNRQVQVIKQGKKTFKISGQVRCLVYVRVRGRAPMGLRIDGVRTAHIQGRTVLSINLKNTGTVIDHTAAVLTFSRQGQVAPYQAQIPIGDLLGGAAMSLALPLNRAVPAGTYQVAMKLIYRAQPLDSAPPVTTQISWNGTLDVFSS